MAAKRLTAKEKREIGEYSKIYPEKAQQEIAYN